MSQLRPASASHLVFRICSGLGDRCMQDFFCPCGLDRKPIGRQPRKSSDFSTFFARLSRNFEISVGKSLEYTVTSSAGINPVAVLISGYSTTNDLVPGFTITSASDFTSVSECLFVFLEILTLRSLTSFSKEEQIGS